MTTCCFTNRAQSGRIDKTTNSVHFVYSICIRLVNSNMGPRKNTDEKSVRKSDRIKELNSGQSLTDQSLAEFRRFPPIDLSTKSDKTEILKGPQSTPHLDWKITTY